MPSSFLKASTAVLCSLVFQTALAHDSWLVKPSNSENTLRLNTGSHFPKKGGDIQISRVMSFGCETNGSTHTPELIKESFPVFEFDYSAYKDVDELKCWAELISREITLNERQVRAYLKETRAPDSIWEAYKENLTKGKGWKEIYQKSATIELGAKFQTRKANLPFQVVISDSEKKDFAKKGENLTFMALINGRPLPNQSLELLVDSASLGTWYQTDSQGLVEVDLPFSGTALIRGTYFDHKDGLFYTDFLTHIFEVKDSEE